MAIFPVLLLTSCGAKPLATCTASHLNLHFRRASKTRRLIFRPAGSRPMPLVPFVPVAFRFVSPRQQEPRPYRERGLPKHKRQERREMCSDLGQGSRICAFYSFTGILFTVSFGSGLYKYWRQIGGERTFFGKTRMQDGCGCVRTGLDRAYRVGRYCM